MSQFLVRKRFNLMPYSYTVIPPSSCKDLLADGISESGQYTLNLGDNEGEFEVYCDMDTDVLGGGWTVIQRRGPGEPSRDYFHKDWKTYRNGFGHFQSSFWLGLEKIKRITASDTYELYIGLEDAFGFQAWARYSTFKIGDEATKYTLTIGGYEGSAGDSLRDHSGHKFSTIDEDNDVDQTLHCSERYSGGWWFERCHDSNLNGVYYDNGSSDEADGISWHHWRSEHTSMKRVVMAIRPRN